MSLITQLTERVRRLREQSAEDFDLKLIAPMILGSILNPINSSIIAVSLVPIGIAFGALPAQTAWLISGLYLATSIGQPVVGRLVDSYGPRRLYLLGAALTGAAGILGTLAPNLGFLVVARVILGFGTCAGYPAAMYLIRRESRRTGHDSPGGVLTVLAVASQTIAVIGPSLGGLLIGLGGWRTTFAVNIPLALACLILGARRLPTIERPVDGVDGVEPAKNRIDVLGMVLFAITLIAFLLFLRDLGWAHVYLLVIAAVAAAGFAFRELRCAEPFIDVRVFGGNLPLMATYLRTLLASTVSYCFLYGFTQWLEAGRGLSAAAAGLILLPMFLTAIVVATATGPRKEIRAKLLVGAVGQIVVCAGLLLTSSTSPIWFLVAAVVIMGIPQGLNNLANQNAVYYQSDPQRVGASAGLLRTCTYLGALIASAANGAFLGRGADTNGLHDLATFMVVAAAAFLVVAAVDRSLGRVGRP